MLMSLNTSSSLFCLIGERYDCLVEDVNLHIYTEANPASVWVDITPFNVSIWLFTIDMHHIDVLHDWARSCLATLSHISGNFGTWEIDGEAAGSNPPKRDLPRRRCFLRQSMPYTRMPGTRAYGAPVCAMGPSEIKECIIWIWILH